MAVARRDERREAVPSAEPEGVAARDVLCQRTSALRGQTVALQPVADRRVPPVERGRDLLDRQPILDKPLKLTPFDRAPGRMQRGVGGDQPVFRHPVDDRRRVLADLAGDGLDGAAGLES